MTVQLGDPRGDAEQRAPRAESRRSWTSVSPSLTAAPAGGSSSRLARVEQLNGLMCWQVVDIIEVEERNFQYVVPRIMRFLA